MHDRITSIPQIESLKIGGTKNLLQRCGIAQSLILVIVLRTLVDRLLRSHEGGELSSDVELTREHTG